VSKEEEFFSFIKNAKPRLIRDVTQHNELATWVTKIGLDAAEKIQKRMNEGAIQLHAITDRTCAAYGTRDMELKVRRFAVRPFMSVIPTEILEEIRFRMLYMYYNGFNENDRALKIIREIMELEANAPYEGDDSSGQWTSF
jgi:hypothetical protein